MTENCEKMLEAVRRELVTLHGLYVTDRPEAYTDALRDGCDANAAAKCVAEVSWSLDETALIAQIDEWLTPERSST